MREKIQKIRSLKLIDLIRTVSLIDLVVVLLLVLVPVGIFAKGKPLNGGRGGGKDESTVKIASIDPESGPKGSTLTVFGVGFTDDNAIKIRGKVITSGISSADGTTIVFVLPLDVPCKPPSACSVKIIVSNQKGESNAYPFKITHDSLIENLVMVTSVLPSGTENVHYETTLQAEGGLTPYTWRVQSGSLPLGLELNPDSGVISGTPTTGGNSTFVIAVKDSNGSEISKEFQIFIESAPVTIKNLTIKGRFIDYFSKQPIAGVDLKKTAESQDAIIQPSNDNGEFVITTTVGELSATTKTPKGFWYYPSCYYYSQFLGIKRNSDNSLVVFSKLFDLKKDDVLYPVSSELIDVGDITIWPATGLRMYFDKELKIMVHYPEEGRATGNAGYLINTDGYLGGNIAPFDYPLTVTLEDRDGNKYSPPAYSQPRSEGCNKNAVLRFFNGEFTWTSE